MKKFLALFIFIQLSLLSVFAGEFEDAYASGKKVFVYFYSPSCITCKNFNPIYDEIAAKHNDIKCIRINIENKNGLSLFRRYHGFYIPYLVLTSKGSKRTVSVPTSCAMNTMCFERVLKDMKS